MKRLKEEKGITLIALIITIIVMLILVAVTINVAINGGLFGKANDAAKDTEKEAIYDQIVSSIVLDERGKINVADTFDSVKVMFGNKVSNETWNGETAVTFEVTGQKGTYKYTITGEEILKEGEKSGGNNQRGGTSLSDEDLIKDYFLGTARTGRALFDVIDMEERTGLDDENSITDASTTVSMITIVGGESEVDGVFLYVAYKDIKYKVAVDISTGETKSVTSLTYDTTGNIGKTAIIDGEKYIVLYDAGEQGQNVQLISANVLEPESVFLGYNDGQIDWTNPAVIAEANLFTAVDGESDDLTNVEKSIYSYNHAIETLNAKCLSLVGTSNADILDVRSVGSNPVNKNSETSSMYSSTLLGTLPENNPTYAEGSFQGKGKNTDTNYITDFDRMLVLGINAPENDQEYWLASRYIDDMKSSLVRSIFSDGEFCNYTVWSVDSSHTYANSDTRGVRPVISISSSNLTKYLD